MPRQATPVTVAQYFYVVVDDDDAVVVAPIVVEVVSCACCGHSAYTSALTLQFRDASGKLKCTKTQLIHS